jgi:hypothetical protein
MSIVYEKALKQDLELGYGISSRTAPGGGTMVGDKIGTHTLLPRVFNVNDFSSVQDALDEAAVEGGTVLVPPGTYYVANLVVGDGVHRVDLQCLGGSVFSPLPTIGTDPMFTWTMYSSSTGVYVDTQNLAGYSGNVFEFDDAIMEMWPRIKDATIYMAYGQSCNGIYIYADDKDARWVQEAEIDCFIVGGASHIKIETADTGWINDNKIKVRSFCGVHSVEIIANRSGSDANPVDQQVGGNKIEIWQESFYPLVAELTPVVDLVNISGDGFVVDNMFDLNVEDLPGLNHTSITADKAGRNYFRGRFYPNANTVVDTSTYHLPNVWEDITYHVIYTFRGTECPKDITRATDGSFTGFYGAGSFQAGQSLYSGIFYDTATKADRIIGTSDSRKLTFITNNNGRVYIAADGKVGIGGDPSQLFDVSNGKYTVSVDGVNVITHAADGEFIDLYGPGSMAVGFSLFSGIFYNGTTTNADVQMGTLSANSVTITTDSSERIIIDSTGKITLKGLPVYADNAAAITGGLTADQLYRTTTGTVMIVY